MGAGESGTGAAILAAAKGFDVFVSDHGTIRDKYKALLDEKQISWEEKTHTRDAVFSAQLVIKSPGIPDNAEIILEIKKRGIPVISEIEFAGRYTPAYTICITGSNGKTTTALLCYDLLKKAGFNVGLAGNVGQSLAMQVAREKHDYQVIELSSFQLDGMLDFHANISIIMNITPDHLDRYDNDFEKYIDSKFRITRHQEKGDFMIYCQDDPVIVKNLHKVSGRPRAIPFSLQQGHENGAWAHENKIIFNINDKISTMSIDDLALKGKHNVYNSMAAGITGHILEIRKETIRDCLTNFQSVEHRLEPVLRVHGIEFINDSKATNVNSTWYALESMQQPVVWIAGGVDKGNDYDALKELVKEKVKAIVCLGKDNSKIRKAFDGMFDTLIETTSMKEAVKTAYFVARKGDTVLLSPACASFDLFDNYEDRGWQFKECVREL